MDKGPLPTEQIRDITLNILKYCRENGWAGYDPYDGLNSRLFKLLPVIDRKIFRLVFMQVNKRFPVNLRPLLGIPKTQNPKALAVFLKALIKLSRAGIVDGKESAAGLVTRLRELRSPGISRYCWGYSFPWQTRGPLVPKGAPNLVCTVFVADSLLEAHETEKVSGCLEMAKSAAEYILNDLYWTDGESSAGFSYPVPGMHGHIHNADLLASALLSRVYSHTAEERFIEPALKVARSAAAAQNADGSWFYGDSPGTRWIDNFHTGYNLLALRDVSRYAGTGEFSSCLERGFNFYRRNFFRPDGAPKYFHNRPYPIDVHCVAQSMITLTEFSEYARDNLELAGRVLQWAVRHMWNDRGFFYYQVHPLFTNKISYMRWSQAWMLLALATILESKGGTVP